MRVQEVNVQIGTNDQASGMRDLFMVSVAAASDVSKTSELTVIVAFAQVALVALREIDRSATIDLAQDWMRQLQGAPPDVEAERQAFARLVAAYEAQSVAGSA